MIRDVKQPVGQRHSPARELLLLAICLMVGAFSTHARAEEAEREVTPLGREPLMGRLKALDETDLPGVHTVWENGLHVTGHFEKVKLRLGGSIMVDGGAVGADEDLATVFNDLEDGKTLLRRLRLNVLGTISRAVEFKTDFDFANAREIKDQWIRFPGVPVLERFRFGHQKEPLSLEEQTSSNYITFMETALPTEAFAPGRNFGIRYDDAAPDLRTTWAGGLFWSTSSYGNTAEAKDSLTNPEGINVTARLTHLLRYENNGKDMLHLGLGYSHQFHYTAEDDSGVKLGAHPETRVTTRKLADTVPFSADNRELVNAEFAMVEGSFSFQSECYLDFIQSNEDHFFWGFYLYGSWFLTGESRKYDRSKAVFTGVDMNHGFHPLRGEWGALELGLRYSYLNVDDGDIMGGREMNYTVGLNWYLYQGVRFMANYIRARVEGREDPPIDEGSANVWALRFQLAF